MPKFTTPSATLAPVPVPAANAKGEVNLVQWNPAMASVTQLSNGGYQPSVSSMPVPAGNGRA